MYTWNVYLEPADTDDPPRFLGTIQAESRVQAFEKAAQFYERPEHDIVVQRAMSVAQENDQAVRCAVEQVPQDMPYVEVLNTSLYKKTETFGDRHELSVQGVRWYVEVEIRNLNDETTATALYRVWCADTGALKATRVTLV